MCYDIQFTNHAHHEYAFHHIFDRVCDENGCSRTLLAKIARDRRLFKAATAVETDG